MFLLLRLNYLASYMDASCRLALLVMLVHLTINNVLRKVRRNMVQCKRFFLRGTILLLV